MPSPDFKDIYEENGITTGNEVKTDEVKTDEVKTKVVIGSDDPLSRKTPPGVDPTNPDEVRKAQNEVKTDEVKTDEVKTDEVKTDEVKTDDQSKGFLETFNEKAGTKYASMEEIYNDNASLKTLRESETNLKHLVANNKNPFEGNEELAKIYQFQKETKLGIEAYSLINGKNFDEMDSLEAMVMNTMLENPELKGKEGLVRESLNRKYGMSNPEDLEDSEKEILQMDIDLAGKTAKKNLKELQSKITAPDFSESAQLSDDAKLQIEEDNKLWEDTIPTLVAEFSKFPVFESENDIAEKKEHLTEIEIPEDVRSEYLKNLSEYVKANNIAPTKENVQELWNVMQKDYISKNYLNIANAYASKKLEVNNAMWKERTGQDISKMKEQHTRKTSSLGKVDDFNKKELDKVLGILPGRRS